MPRDRWLLGFVAGAALLVVIAVVAVVTATGGAPVQYPEQSPVGVVQRYLLAIDSGRWTEADSYLGEEARKRLQAEPAVRPVGVLQPDTTRRIVLVSEETLGDRATVIVDVTTFNRSGPAESSSWTQRIALELRLESGQWKIVQPEYPPF